MNRADRRKKDIFNQSAFQQAFIQAEIAMRHALAKKIDDAAEQETSEDKKYGMLAARKIILGELSD